MNEQTTIPTADHTPQDVDDLIFLGETSPNVSQR